MFKYKRGIHFLKNDAEFKFWHFSWKGLTNLRGGGGLGSNQLELSLDVSIISSFFSLDISSRWVKIGLHQNQFPGLRRSAFNLCLSLVVGWVQTYYLVTPNLRYG